MKKLWANLDAWVLIAIFVLGVIWTGIEDRRLILERQVVLEAEVKALKVSLEGLKQVVIQLVTQVRNGKRLDRPGEN